MPDPVTAAQAAVGWYGDPTVSWSVLLAARLAEPADPSVVGDRLAATVARYPRLGTAPAVQPVGSVDWPAMLASFADQPYRTGCPLVRVAVGAESAQLLIAAHHGVTDGLGLLALLGEALGATVATSAHGIGDRRARSSFARTATCRLVEALLHPPARVAPNPGLPANPGPLADPSTRWQPIDVLHSAELPARVADTAALVAATARAIEHWNRRHRTPIRRLVAGVGVSRRGGDRLTPEPDSAFLRLRLPAAPSRDMVRRLIAGQLPEPDFPHTRAAAPRLATGMLAGRLGSTFLASNLGLVAAGPRVRALTFYPVASGRSGLAVGAATVGAITTVTIRARRRAFDVDSVEKLLASIITEL